MKNVILIVVFALFSLNLEAQQQKTGIENDVKVGTMLTINKPSTQEYMHIQFPRRNIIIKRGGIVNMNNISGKEVVVSKIGENRKGVVVVTLKRADGRKFFNSFPIVKANLNDALAAGELVL
ncbi:hypothetical protein [Maribacter arcticus]|uniref:Dihydroorotase n=1 Tax=Maribacter arcticus TaxID=561365 RepID=A0A1T5CI08_9FLAO|nr:hypothetical protein [Maribacter arcticus]SKB59122.1 hypothetical protein SAMN05660866_02317 [Maribacter arcticus]